MQGLGDRFGEIRQGERMRHREPVPGESIAREDVSNQMDVEVGEICNVDAGCFL